MCVRCTPSPSTRYGIYPLTAFSAQKPPATRPRAISPETAESVKSATPEPLDIETRKVVNMICSVKPREENCELFVSTLLPKGTSLGASHVPNDGFDALMMTMMRCSMVVYPVLYLQMTILLRMDDKMNRQLTCPISADDSAVTLSHELVHLGFIHEVTMAPHQCLTQRRRMLLE